MAATSTEGIESQHKASIAMVNASHPSAQMIDRGEIPLEWKQSPTVEDPLFTIISSSTTATQPEAEDSNNSRRYGKGSCVSSRGMIDVEPLANLIAEGCHDAVQRPTSQSSVKKIEAQSVKSETNLWDDENARHNNVYIKRPSHDNWGIKKIVLMFCDDFLQTVYEMPWWHNRDSKIRDAIQPILTLLAVPPERVVRMLLAALPPGVTIPVHEDSGEWVRYTHRIHVPVIVNAPEKVLFQCGPTETTMERISCTPGHVFEMNNQAKHSVSNCQSTNFRVHLILDYVDSSFTIKRRIPLKPGETMVQTRRTVDRALDADSRPTPSFMIIGAQKSGTTSLYEYMNKHPLVIRPKRRETHCLDWRWNNSLTTTAKRRDHCLSFFFAKELRTRPSCLTGDSTPSYLLDSYRCIPRLKEVFSWKKNHMKFFAILRDPVKRALSHKVMVSSLDGTPEQIQNRGTEWLNMTFEEIVELDMKNMKECGLIPYWNLETKTMNLDFFEKFSGTKEEDDAFQQYLKDHVPMMTGSHSLISRGMYELQLRQWFQAFSPESFLVLKLEDMKIEGGVQKIMNKVWMHLDLPSYKVKDDTPKNARSYTDSLSAEMEDMLKRFYAPHNQRLRVLIGDDWLNPW